MKKPIHLNLENMNKLILLLIVTFSFCLHTFSQESVTVSELSNGKQWQIIEKAFYDSGYKVGKFTPNENTILTNWVQWKVVTIQNRGILKVELSGQDATISMIERSYKTSDKWDASIGKLSKKNKKKYLQKLADKIIEINASAAMTEDAVENSILFPTFKSITKVLGVEWKVDSIYQNTESSKKQLILCFTLTNTNSYSVTLDVYLYAPDLMFLGVQAKMENCGDYSFRPVINPGGKTSGNFCYFSSEIITKIPKYYIRHNVHNGVKNITGELIIYDIDVPYYSE